MNAFDTPEGKILAATFGVAFLIIVLALFMGD
jgi:hypothetical protein